MERAREPQCALTVIAFPPEYALYFYGFLFQLHLWTCLQIFDLETKRVSIHTPGSPNSTYESNNYILYFVPLIVDFSVLCDLWIIDMKQTKYEYQ